MADERPILVVTQVPTNLVVNQQLPSTVLIAQPLGPSVGAAGPAGPAGSRGSTGNTGPTGPQGATGETPSDFVVSINGITGIVGLSAGDNITITQDGITFTISSTATAGGITGPYVRTINGFTGGVTLAPGNGVTFTSVDGIITFAITGIVEGSTGPTGPTGPQGNTGNTGQGTGYTAIGLSGGYLWVSPVDINGVRGASFSIGYVQGNTGEPGTPGIQGNTGNTGEPGTPGIQGNTGNTGNTGATGPTGENGSGYTGAEIRSNYLYVTKVFPNGTTMEINLGYIGPTGSEFVFETDLIAAFGSGKFFGKYVNGDTIPAQNKTAAQVIREALVAILPLGATLTSSSTILFNQTAISNSINFSHSVNTLNAVIAGATLEWNRTGSAGYTVLSESTSSSGTYVHSLTDSNFNTNAFNYRYRVTDSLGGTGQATLSITPQTYASPTVAITKSGPNTSSPETSTKREKGNVATNISATITKNRVNVPLTGFQWQYQENGGAWQNASSFTTISGNPGSTATGTLSHSTANTVTSSRYRLLVTDTYQDFQGASFASSDTLISYANMIFYGASASAPSTSAQVRSLPDRIFIDTGSNPFNLNSGVLYVNFTVAMPSTSTITNVTDLDALGADITSQYVLNSGLTGILDYAGNTANYNVYTMTQGGTYSSNHRHQVTRT